MLYLNIIQNIDQWVYNSLYVIYLITIIGTILVIISENRNPVKSIAWIVVLLFLPIVGIVFYFFFGQEYRRQHMISRKGKRKLQQLTEDPDVDLQEMPLSEESKQQIRLAYTLGKSGLHPGNEVTVFTNGKDKFASLIEDIKNAQTFIHLQYYIFANDRLGNTIKQLLIDKVKEGVIVRVIYDDVGCWKVKQHFFDEMEAADVDERPFLKVTFPQLANKLNYRNHRKIVIIDGKIGYVGGMNIADRYQDGVAWGIWRDTHIRITGPAVYGLQTAFSIDWSFTTRELLSDNIYFPPVPRTGNINVQILTSGPIGEWKGISLSFLKAISNAKQHIYIQTPYFLPTESLMKALQVAALSKVDVRLMLPEKSDSPILQLASHSYLTSMLKAGIKIYFYQNGFLHAKSITIDNEFSTIGSTNLDFRSFDHNFEINAFMYSKELTTQMKNIFLDDQKKCRRITLNLWKKRPLWHKICESVVRLLSPVL